MTTRFNHVYYSNRLKRPLLVGFASLAMVMNVCAYADEYVDKAKGYISKNKLESAVIELKNAIQSSPEKCTTPPHARRNLS